MTTYALATTFILGTLFGFFGFCAVVLLCIRHDNKTKARKDLEQKARSVQNRFGGTHEQALAVVSPQ